VRAIRVPTCVHIKTNEREVEPWVIAMRDQYDSRNKPRRNGREMGTWRLTSIRVVNRTPALSAVAPVFEGVDVGDVGSRGQLFEVHVVAILVVGVEHGVLVGRIGFAAQQEGERHGDSGLY
jgi:hypothetical protein